MFKDTCCYTLGKKASDSPFSQAVESQATKHAMYMNGGGEPRNVRVRRVATSCPELLQHEIDGENAFVPLDVQIGKSQ